MPVKKRASKGRAFNDDHVLQLIEGPRSISILGGMGYLHPYLVGSFDVLDDDRKADLLDTMRGDWQTHRDGLLNWWVFGGKHPCAKPWNFTLHGGPGSRPWAWHAFDAPEDFDGETDLAALDRLGMLLPGEADAASRA